MLEQRDRSWKLRQSWYILLTLPAGVTSWIAFLYIGIRAKHTSWIVWGIFYLGSMIAMLMQPRVINAAGQEAIPLWAGYRLILLWLFSIGHAFWVRRDYLERLDLRMGGTPAPDTEFVPFDTKQQAAPQPAARPRRVDAPLAAAPPAPFTPPQPPPASAADPVSPSAAAPPPPPPPPFTAPPPAPKDDPPPPPPRGGSRVVDF